MEELTTFLRDAGFLDIKTYGNLKMRAPQAGEDRIFFVARKDPAAIKYMQENQNA